mgnify:CR=1 FL=1
MSQPHLPDQALTLLMHRTIDQQIAEATNKLQRLKSKKKTRDTRLKIVVGAAMLAEARANPDMAQQMTQVLQARVTRPVDIKEIAPLLAELSTRKKKSPSYD